MSKAINIIISLLLTVIHASMASSKVSLKLLIDKNGHRVLFAEAGKDFVDFLSILLTLPIATVIRLLNNNNNNKKDMVGSFGELYQSISDLSDDYMQSNQLKDVVLKPKSSLSLTSSQAPLLPVGEWWSPPPRPTTAKAFYTCQKCSDSSFSPVSSRGCSRCGYAMTTVVTHYVPTTSAVVSGAGFVKGVVTYMIMDDLAVKPMSTISSITLLNKFKIKDVSVLEEKDVQVGMDEGLEILRHALGSKTVLTNVFLATKDEDLEDV